MKYILVSLLLTITVLNASDYLTIKEEKVIIEKFAKSQRRDLWQSGYENVSSSFEKFSKKSFEKFIKKDSISYQQYMSNSEILDAEDCIKSRTCSLYIVEVSSERYGGWGFEYIIVSLNRNTKKLSSERYLGYSE